MMKNTALYILYSLLIELLCPCPVMAQSLQWDTVLYRQANEYRTKGDYPNALTAFRECYTRAAADRDSLHMGNSLIGMGIVYDEQGSLDTALRYYFDALTIYRNIDNPVKTGGTLKNIGNVYRVLKHYDKAADYLQQALAIQKGQRDSIRIGNVLNDIGLVYMDQDSNAIAKQYFGQVINQYGRAVNKEIKAYVYNNLGIIAANEKQYSQAQSYYRSGLALMQELGKKYGIALILDNMGDAWFEAGDYRQALGYYNQSHELARSINTNELLRSVYDDYAKLYSKTGDYRKAYDYLGLSSKLKDTVYQEESRKAYAEMSARYETEKKQTRIQLLERDYKIANIELVAQRRAKYLFLLTSALILLLAVLMYRSYLTRKKANQQLNLLNKQLTEANSSKTKILGIISHDLRSPVSSLFHFLQLKKIRKGQQDPKEQEAFDQKISQSAENLLETMEDLLIWSKSQMEQFEPVMENLDVEDIFDEIIDLHTTAAANKQIRLLKDQIPYLEIHTDPNFVRIILRNLVSNAIKFTPPHGTVTLSASRENNLILLHVSDSGPGISPADINNIFEWNSIRSDSSGLGLKLVREFTERLSGQLTVVSGNGKGAEFTVGLPAKQSPVSAAVLK
ncbi:tetratricopeptide repeat-containing sensor histidine kinase [Paraflavitalea sp. CAU 1676]|uniref:tetratricopeptide repeat-containing sensor histidine kinase n=1 Tax=Paraflavitalea sp. CAU 1676 TaxID=3032598 RepID=UPI0023DC759E|nr:tetratricopeptide repeat-containing sensor histidine kinase [Paraflavitalea sp. CAU 1676]MDF2187569.1 tetratricopeptide repeat-containing sensor histidine kinase [Paraflavitalea sp. CAU 1676]